jgi:hypothetical protein
VFCPDDGSALTLLTQEVRDALIAARITGIDLDRITEIKQLVIEPG